MVFIKLKSSAHDTTVDDKVGPNVALNGLDKLSRDEKAGVCFPIFGVRGSMRALYSVYPLRALLRLALANQDEA